MKKLYVGHYPSPLSLIRLRNKFASSPKGRRYLLLLCNTTLSPLCPPKSEGRRGMGEGAYI
ncbi:MAG: hypothetical protein QME05_03225 [Candidatus Margulisbacteria bacterium]|nr:hypothetical protein [Candidatus Margulisiibacteriota bacterium]